MQIDVFNRIKINIKWGWGLGIGDWGLGPIPNPHSPIPNPQSPFTVFNCLNFINNNICNKNNLLIFQIINLLF